MKRKFLGYVVILLCIFSFQSNLAEAKSAAEAEKEKQEETWKKLEEKKAELNGTQWEIQITTQVAKTSMPKTDTLIFQDGKFRSEALSKKGFSPTNYTLTLQEGGPTVWETMQTGSDKKEGVAFVRGEWKGNVMSGVIVRQLEAGNEDYYFSNTGKKKISPTSSKEGSKEGAIVPLTTEETTPLLSSGGTTKPKEEKKKSWFLQT